MHRRTQPSEAPGSRYRQRPETSRRNEHSRVRFSPRESRFSRRPSQPGREDDLSNAFSRLSVDRQRRDVRPSRLSTIEEGDRAMTEFRRERESRFSRGTALSPLRRVSDAGMHDSSGRSRKHVGVNTRHGDGYLLSAESDARVRISVYPDRSSVTLRSHSEERGRGCERERHQYR
jgi:hypothetical protein